MAGGAAFPEHGDDSVGRAVNRSGVVVRFHEPRRLPAGQILNAELGPQGPKQSPNEAHINGPGPNRSASQRPAA